MDHPALPNQWDLTFSGVYRLTPDFGTMTLLVEDFVIPNGLAFSPDEKILYINASRRRLIRTFELEPQRLARPAERPRVRRVGRPRARGPRRHEGDTEGNAYYGGAGDIWIMDPKGKKLGRIVHGAPATTNISLGGGDWKTLYFTSRNLLGAVNVKIPGIPVPVAKNSG
jgi:gluconolactonase